VPLVKSCPSRNRDIHVNRTISHCPSWRYVAALTSLQLYGLLTWWLSRSHLLQVAYTHLFSSSFMWSPFVNCVHVHLLIRVCGGFPTTLSLPLLIRAATVPIRSGSDAPARSELSSLRCFILQTPEKWEVSVQAVLMRWPLAAPMDYVGLLSSGSLYWCLSLLAERWLVEYNTC